MTSSRRSKACFACLIAIALAASTASGQPQPGNPYYRAPAGSGNVPQARGNIPNPYQSGSNSPYYRTASYPVPYSPYVYGGDPYGGYLSGAADVLNAQGDYLKNVQQAYIMREQAVQAKIDTRRSTYDEWLYERANTPTLNETREKYVQEEIRRSLNNPPVTEIWSGKSLNDLLKSLQSLQNKGIEGPPVPLSTELLANINLTTGTGPVSAGLLKSKLNWPYGLEILEPAKENDALRAKIETLMNTAQQQASTGKINARTIQELGKSVDTLRNNLVSKINDFATMDYIAARRFVTQLEDTVKTLKTADASSYVTGKYAARGRTVKELVANMTNEGLIFAPAAPGEQSYYTALHSAMVRYNITTVELLSQK